VNYWRRRTTWRSCRRRWRLRSLALPAVSWAVDSRKRGERRSACAASPSSSRNRPETPLRIGCGHLRTHSQSGWLPTCRPRRARRPVAWRQSFSVLTIRRRPTLARPNHGVIGIEGGAIDPPEGLRVPHALCVFSCAREAAVISWRRGSWPGAGAATGMLLIDSAIARTGVFKRRGGQKPRSLAPARRQCSAL
jgi:hypothetical protein